MGAGLCCELQSEQQRRWRRAVPDLAARARDRRKLMATALEQGFIAAVAVAAGIRQTAYAAAFATYAPNGFGVFANLGTYLAALVTADNAFYTAVQSAATTAGISPAVVASLNPGMIPGGTANILT